jgi:RNA polymerase sigma factor (sigma-70 family)
MRAVSGIVVPREMRRVRHWGVLDSTTLSEGYWDRVGRTHSTTVYRLAYRLAGNPHDAEDISRGVFVRVFNALPSVLQGNFEARLKGVTASLFLELVRRRQQSAFEPAGNTGDEPVADNDPILTKDEATLNGEVQAALNALAPDVRAAVLLNDLAGLTHGEIAAVLGIRRRLVRSWVYHGRAQLHAELSRCARSCGGHADTAGVPGDDGRSGSSVPAR